jgi:hypothetical protein
MDPNNQPLTREELRQKLRAKIASARQPQQKAVTQKQYNKMMKTVKSEMKKLKQDDRVTDEMLLLYDKLNNEYKQVKVPSPSEILNNIDLAKTKFKEYLKSLIDKCKEYNISQQKFEKDYLNSEYTRYMVMVAGLEIVPESLRSRINFNKEQELPMQRVIDKISTD